MIKIKALSEIVKGEGKTKYTCGPVVYIEAKAGAVLADHVHEGAETLWILSGKGVMQVGKKDFDFKGPCVLEVPGNIYHKFMPETDVNFIELRQGGWGNSQ